MNIKVGFIFLMTTCAFAQGVSELPKTSLNQNSQRRNTFEFFTPDKQTSMRISGFIQQRFEYQNSEAEPDRNTFRVRAGRMALNGHVFSRSVRYSILYEFADNTLFDAFIDLGETEALTFRMGQFRLPYNWEVLTPLPRLAFADRSLAQGYFGVPTLREPGLSIFGKLGQRKFEYFTFLSNGEGRNRLNQNQGMRYGARMVFNILEPYGHQRGELFTFTKKAALSMAAATMYNQSRNNNGSINIFSSTAELSTKWKRLGFHGAYFFQTTEDAQSRDDQGYLAQLSCLLIDKKLEAGLRSVGIFSEERANQKEYTLALNAYPIKAAGERVQFQAEVSVLETRDETDPSLDRSDIRGRLQMQLQF